LISGREYTHYLLDLKHLTYCVQNKLCKDWGYSHTDFIISRLPMINNFVYLLLYHFLKYMIDKQLVYLLLKSYRYIVCYLSFWRLYYLTKRYFHHWVLKLNETVDFIIMLKGVHQDLQDNYLAPEAINICFLYLIVDNLFGLDTFWIKKTASRNFIALKVFIIINMWIVYCWIITFYYPTQPYT